MGEASLCAPFSFIIYHLSFSEAPLRANLNLSQNFKQLFSQSDGVALRHKHYSVESVGNDEDWELGGALQFHSLYYLVLDSAVDVETKAVVCGQRSKLGNVEALGVGFVFKEEHEWMTTGFKLLAYLYDIFKGVVGWFLTCSQDTYYVIASACLGKYALLYLFLTL